MPCDVNDPNVRAFRKLIRYAEHYPDKSDNFYDTLYGGDRFVGYTTHPHRRVFKWRKWSDAAGAYQILFSTWSEAKGRGIVSDFSPASQDRLAFEKLRTRGALSAICSGDLTTAYRRLVNEWTALPGAGQSRMSPSAGRAAFIEFGGKPR